MTTTDAAQVEQAFAAKLMIFGAGNAERPQTSAATKQPLAPSHTDQQPTVAITDQRRGGKAIDKSGLTIPEPRRVRDRDHVKSVANQPCLVCGRRPADAHHLRFAQSRALGRKVSDEFTVPLCRGHHRQVHHCGDEAAWWKRAGINPTVTARALWLETHPLPTPSDKVGLAAAISIATIGADQNKGDEASEPILLTNTTT